jgi:23S rRNA pseudouridine1911/1915/1917 synthase
VKHAKPPRRGGKSDVIDIPNAPVIPILYEDRSVLAIDKPAGWLLAPADWDKTSRNLHRELLLSIQAGDHWARSRHIRFVRHVHRLDADTSGVLLLAKSHGALSALSRLFEARGVKKKYVALVQGVPKVKEWTCRLSLGPQPGYPGQVRVDLARGNPAETQFRVLESRAGQTLIEAVPVTGRTHQIRVHLAAAGHPIVGDPLYGKTSPGEKQPFFALRAIELSYTDPFQNRPVRIVAPPPSWSSP